MLRCSSVLPGLLLMLLACREGTSPTRVAVLRAGDVVNGDVRSGAPVVYRTMVKAGDQLAIYFQVPDAPLALTLLDQSGASVASIGGGHDPVFAPQIRWVKTPLLSTDAEYTIEIAASGSTQEGTFRLEASPFNTGPESGASTIAANTIVQEKIDGGADIDQYTLNAVAGQELEVFLQVSGPGEPGGLVAVLERPDNFGNAVFSTAVPSDSDFEQSSSGVLIVQTTAQYRLTVSSRFAPPSGYVGPYRVEVRAIDHAPEHTAASLVPGDTIASESIDYVGDVDDFTLAGPPGTEYNVFLDASGTTSHRVEAQALNLSQSIAATPGGPSLLENATGRFVMPPSGSVTIRVRDVFNARGPYRLFAARINHGPEGIAPVIAAGAEATTSAIEILGDVDEYSFTLSTPATLNLLLSRGADATGSGLHAQILSAASTTPVSIYTDIAARATSPSISTGHLALAPGSYRLRIAGESSRGDGYRGSYQVQLRTVNPAPETAVAQIAAGDTVRGETLEYAGDIDSFVLTVAPGDTLNVKVLTAATVNPGIWFAIWDPITKEFRGGSKSDENNPSAPLQSGRLALEPGDYPLVVQSANGGSIPTEQGGYQLVVDRVSARPEHHAAVIALGDTVSDEPIDYVGDYDDFYLRGQPGSEVVARFVWNQGSSGYGNGLGALALVDSTTGAALAGAPSAGAWQESRRVAFPPAGVLRIRVQAASARTGSYSFTTIPISRAPESRAAAFTLGDTVSEAINPAADIDEFVFQGTAGQSVDAFLQAPNGLAFYGSVQLELVDLSSNSVLATVAATGGSLHLEDFNRRGIVLPSSGSYLVRIQDVADFPEPANYRFRIAPSP
jgi:hypothetical protein